MSNIKSESLVWLDNLAALEAQLQKTPSATHTQLADTLNLKRPYVSLLLALQPILDLAAIEKIRLAAFPKSGISSHSGAQAATISFILSFNSAKALLPLGKMADPSGSVHSALDVILSQRLATKHILALVDEMISGKPAETFDPKAKRPKRVRQAQGSSARLAPSTFKVAGPHGQALLDYMREVGLKSPALEAIYTRLFDFKPSSRNDDIYLKELKAYLEKLFMEYGVKVGFK